MGQKVRGLAHDARERLTGPLLRRLGLRRLPLLTKLRHVLTRCLELRLVRVGARARVRVRARVRARARRRMRVRDRVEARVRVRVRTTLSCTSLTGSASTCMHVYMYACMHAYLLDRIGLDKLALIGVLKGSRE